MNTVSDTAPHTPDMAQAALAALTRAGLRAAEDARRTNTCMVVAEDGKVLHLSPQDYMRQRTQLEAASVAQDHARSTSTPLILNPAVTPSLPMPVAA